MMKMNRLKKLWNKREELIAYGLFFIFGAGLTLLYLSLVTTIADVTLKWVSSLNLEPAFSIKGLELVLGAALIALGLGFLGWAVLMYYYNKYYWRFAEVMEFIDPTKRIRDNDE